MMLETIARLEYEVNWTVDLRELQSRAGAKRGRSNGTTPCRTTILKRKHPSDTPRLLLTPGS